LIGGELGQYIQMLLCYLSWTTVFEIPNSRVLNGQNAILQTELLCRFDIMPIVVTIPRFREQQNDLFLCVYALVADFCKTQFFSPLLLFDDFSDRCAHHKGQNRQ
jgi:hypothetical protein